MGCIIRGILVKDRAGERDSGELEASAGGVSWQSELDRGERGEHRASERSGEGAHRHGAVVHGGQEAGLRTGNRHVRGRQAGQGQPDGPPHQGRRRLAVHLRLCALQRLERQGRAGLGVRAAGPLQRQELRHLDFGLDRDLRGPRALQDRLTEAGPHAAAVLGREAARVVRHPAAGVHPDQAERQPGLQLQLQAPVLVARATIGPPRRHRLQHEPR